MLLMFLGVMGESLVRESREEGRKGMRGGGGKEETLRVTGRRAGCGNCN